jgi:hypothetical protein
MSLSFYDLPNEIIIKFIFSYVPYMRPILNQVSPQFKNLAADNLIWWRFSFTNNFLDEDFDPLLDKEKYHQFCKMFIFDDILSIISNADIEDDIERVIILNKRLLSLFPAACTSSSTKTKTKNNIIISELPNFQLPFYSYAAALGCNNIIDMFFTKINIEKNNYSISPPPLIDTYNSDVCSILIDAAMSAANWYSLLNLSEYKFVYVSIKDIHYKISHKKHKWFCNTAVNYFIDLYDKNFEIKKGVTSNIILCKSGGICNTNNLNAKNICLKLNKNNCKIFGRFLENQAASFLINFLRSKDSFKEAGGLAVNQINQLICGALEYNNQYILQNSFIKNFIINVLRKIPAERSLMNSHRKLKTAPKSDVNHDHLDDLIHSTGDNEYLIENNIYGATSKLFIDKIIYHSLQNISSFEYLIEIFSKIFKEKNEIFLTFKSLPEVIFIKKILNYMLESSFFFNNFSCFEMLFIDKKFVNLRPILREFLLEKKSIFESFSSIIIARTTFKWADFIYNLAIKNEIIRAEEISFVGIVGIVNNIYNKNNLENTSMINNEISNETFTSSSVKLNKIWTFYQDIFPINSYVESINEDYLLEKSSILFENDEWKNAMNNERKELEEMAANKTGHFYLSFLSEIDTIANTLFSIGYFAAADLLLQNVITPAEFNLPWIIRTVDCIEYQLWKYNCGAVLTPICWMAAARETNFLYLNFLASNQIPIKFDFFNIYLQIDEIDMRIEETYIYGCWPHSSVSRMDEFRLKIMSSFELFSFFSDKGIMPLQLELESAFINNYIWVLDWIKKKIIENKKNDNKSIIANNIFINFDVLSAVLISNINALCRNNYFWNFDNNSINWINKNKDFLMEEADVSEAVIRAELDDARSAIIEAKPGDASEAVIQPKAGNTSIKTSAFQAADIKAFLTAISKIEF